MRGLRSDYARLWGCPEQRCEDQVEGRCAVWFAEDECFDAGAVGGGSERCGELWVADARGGVCPEFVQSRREAAAKLGVARGGADELEEQERELAIKRHRLGRWLGVGLVGLFDPDGELLIEEREEEAFLGAEVVIQGSFGAAGFLAHPV